MRYINKTLILATEYHTWLSGLKKKKHPKYNSSSFKYYSDIVANLIWVQNGLCAYSEKKLQDHAPFETKHWISGSFPKKYSFSGQLDHYNNTLKANYGWLWDNFFVVDSDINMKEKRSNTPSGVLNPGLVAFNSMDFLEYDVKNHFFIPKKTIAINVQKQVLDDINYLGLNFQPIVDLRKLYLNPIINKVKYKRLNIHDAEKDIYQFFTAFELCKPYMV